MFASSARDYCFDPSPDGVTAAGEVSGGLLGDGASADFPGCADFSVGWSAGCTGVAGGDDVCFAAESVAHGGVGASGAAGRAVAAFPSGTFVEEPGSIGVTGDGTYCNGGDRDGGAGVAGAAAGVAGNR